MTAHDILEMIGDTRGEYLLQAQQHRAGIAPKARLSPGRSLLIAAVIALMLLLVGCTIAYAQGWFVDFFQKKSDAPLTPEQIRYIEENEQVIGETQAQNGWTVELKSTMCDGETGYISFVITAPEDVDLEGLNITDRYDSMYIVPGNCSWASQGRRNIITASTGPADQELNYIWQSNSHWEADGDGLPNTLDYVIEIRCEKLFPNKEQLLRNPFGNDVEFSILFDDFTLEYEDQAVRESLDAKYADQEAYMLDGEELSGLHKSEILVEGEWAFTIVFDMDSQNTESIELITEPLTVEAKVHRKIDNGTMFYDTVHSLEQIKLTSFVLTPLGATLQYQEDDTIIGVFFEYQYVYEYEDRYIYVITTDGNKIALHTDGVGTVLTAAAPIVLSEANHILMGDGTVIPVPAQ